MIAALSFVKGLYEDGCGYFYDQRYQNTGDFALYLNPMALSSTAGAPYVIGDINTSVENGGVDVDWVMTTMPPVAEGGERAAQVFVPSISVLVSTPEEELGFLALPQIPDRARFAGHLGQQHRLLLDHHGPERPADHRYLHERSALPLPPAGQRDPGGFGRAHLQRPAVASFSPVRGLLGEAYSDVTLNGRDPVEVAEELELAANELVDELD